jgi:hypothetical protein
MQQCPSFLILEQYGEIESTLTTLEQLDNAKERAITYYARFHILLLRIAESQPVAESAILNLLTVAAAEAQLATEALEATLTEAKQDWLNS